MKSTIIKLDENQKYVSAEIDRIELDDNNDIIFLNNKILNLKAERKDIIDNLKEIDFYTNKWLEGELTEEKWEGIKEIRKKYRLQTDNIDLQIEEINNKIKRMQGMEGKCETN